MIRQLHERIDGSGYPNGLRGSEILLQARIIAAADTFDSYEVDAFLDCGCFSGSAATEKVLIET